jgi:ABC-type uncharacterized transport system permease subunit
MTPTLTVLALLAYLGSAFAYFFELTRWGRRAQGWGTQIMWGALALHLVSIVQAIPTVGLTALFGLPYGLSLVALFLVAGYLALGRSFSIRPVGNLVAPLAVILLALAGPAVTLSEPMRGVILPVHIALSFAGTVAFALAFGVAVLYLLQEYQLKTKRFGAIYRTLPSLDELDAVNLRCVTVGFPIYTAAILLGVIFAFQEHSDAFEPAKLLAFSSWLIYGLVLHSRLTAGWRGKKASAMTIVGFVSAAGVVVAYLVR